MDISILLEPQTIGGYGRVAGYMGTMISDEVYDDIISGFSVCPIAVDIGDNLLAFRMQDEDINADETYGCGVDALLYVAIELIKARYEESPSPNYIMAINRIEIAIKMLESKDVRRK